MADSFDFGFTGIVDQDELTTKTGESAGLLSMRRLQKTSRKLQSHLRVQSIQNK